MPNNKKKNNKWIEVSAVLLGVIYMCLSIIAERKKRDSIYEDVSEQKNPMEGKNVIFVYDENDKVNADGMKGHLETISMSVSNPGIYDKYIKRVIDIALSFAGLIILSPVYAGIALAIKIEDPGPALFTQKRVGKNKQYFKLHKFRSMKVSTPHDVPTHMLENPEQYITKVGKFIRRHSLDELPQIWDIFIGNMSVIGPRPGLWNQDVLIAERDKYGANDVKPGLTGWAQINGRDELEIPLKAKLDGEYVKKESLLLDIRCFFRTLEKVAKDDSILEGCNSAASKSKKKKVVVLSSHTPSLFWFRMDMMKDFISKGYDVFALGNECEEIWKSQFQEQNITYRQIEVERNGVNPLYDLKTLRSIRKQLIQIKPDKVFTFQAKTIIYGGVAAKLLGIREVYPLVAGMGSIFLKHDLKTKIIRAVMVAEYKFAMHQCPVVFFQNKDDVQIFKKAHILGKQKVVMLHGSGVNVEHFAVQPLPEQTAFLCISRLIRDKGVCEYLEAARKVKENYPNVRCMLVGPFDSNPSAIKPEELQPFIDDGIEYFGEQVDVRPYIAQCTVFVLPSYREGTPKTVLEAMASGRAIITTDAPGCRETVINGKNGVLVTAKDVDGLYDAMEQFIRNPDVSKPMAVESRKLAGTVFNVELVNKTICEAMGMIN